jgi:hypothetical protein
LNNQENGQSTERWYYQNFFGLPIGPMKLPELQLAIDRQELTVGMKVHRSDRTEENKNAEWVFLEDLPAALGLRFSSTLMPPFPGISAGERAANRFRNLLLAGLLVFTVLSGLAYVGLKQWKALEQEQRKREVAEQALQAEQKNREQVFKGAVRWLRDYRSEMTGVREENGPCPKKEVLRIAQFQSAELQSIDIVPGEKKGLCDIVGRLREAYFPEIPQPTLSYRQLSTAEWKLETNVPGDWIARADVAIQAESDRDRATLEIAVARQNNIPPEAIASAEAELLALGEFKAVIEQNWRKRSRCVDSNDPGMKSPKFYANQRRKNVYFYTEQDFGNCMILAELVPSVRLFPYVPAPSVFLQFNPASKVWTAGASIHRLTEFKLTAGELEVLEQKQQ